MKNGARDAALTADGGKDIVNDPDVRTAVACSTPSI